mmetsp:Transcript_56753/g.138055  ORF Transcript_56753/g.138055 Transcript_56753/m.138055 type:complete len:336 (-) Transcript_56753:2037-3044(-)
MEHMRWELALPLEEKVQPLEPLPLPPLVSPFQLLECLETKKMSLAKMAVMALEAMMHSEKIHSMRMTKKPGRDRTVMRGATVDLGHAVAVSTQAQGASQKEVEAVHTIQMRMAVEATAQEKRKKAALAVPDRAAEVNTLGQGVSQKEAEAAPTIQMRMGVAAMMTPGPNLRGAGADHTMTKKAADPRAIMTKKVADPRATMTNKVADPRVTTMAKVVDRSILARGENQKEAEAGHIIQMKMVAAVMTIPDLIRREVEASLTMMKKVAGLGAKVNAVARNRTTVMRTAADRITVTRMEKEASRKAKEVKNLNLGENKLITSRIITWIMYRLLVVII